MGARHGLQPAARPASGPAARAAVRDPRSRAPILHSFPVAMKKNKRFFPVALSALAMAGSAACGGAAGGGPTVVAQDSAGVHVVTSARPAWEEGRGWTVDAEPDAAVGVVDGLAAYQFSRVRGAVRLSTGTLVVADGDARELR